MGDLKYDTSWEESLESEDFKRSLTADLVFEAIRRRIELGLSQQDLADIINSTQSVISRFENLGRQPSIAFLERIAKALELNLRATLNGDYMYVVPYRLQTYIRQSAETQEAPIGEYLRNAITDYIDGCARETWSIISNVKVESGKEAVVCQIDKDVFESSDWIRTHLKESDSSEENHGYEDLQVLAEM